MNSIKNMFKLMTKHKNTYIWSSICAVLSVGSGFIPFLCIYNVIMHFINKSINKEYIIYQGLICILFIILKQIFFGISTALSHKASFDILYDLRVQIAKKMQKVSLGFLDNKNSGEIKKVMLEDVEALEQFLAHNVPEVSSNIAVIVLFTIILGFINIWLTLAILAILPFTWYALKSMLKVREQKLEKFYNSMMNMNSTMVEYVKGIKVIKIFNNSNKSYKKYEDSVNDFHLHVLGWFGACFKYMSIYNVIIGASIFFVIPVGAILYFNGNISLSVYVLFLLCAFVYYNPLLKMTDFIENIEMISESERRVSELVNIEELDNVKEVVNIKNYDIEFNKVDFGYNEKNVIKNVSFLARQNEITALVGPSGSGKSTIGKLIGRFWNVNNGKITIGGENINNISLEYLMDMMSFVFQDAYMFNISIKDNIALGKENASEDEIIEASKKANCHEFIINLPNGYNTILGEEINSLSGGEKQRISIARAILKDPKIVILDEATAFTDAENEDKICEALNSLTKGKTIIMIAHRLSTIVDAEKIIVVKDGQIENSGTHMELLKKSSQYKEMWMAHQEMSEWKFWVSGGALNA